MTRYFVPIITLLSLLCSTGVHAQTDTAKYFIGFTPSVTVEPFYESGEFDINIVPLVFQGKLFERSDLRITSLVNYGIRKDENKLSHVGIEIALPTRLFGKSLSKSPEKGFFVAPVFSLSQEQVENETHIGLWVEPGYQFLFDKQYSMSIGLQAGFTLINNKRVNHFGVNVIIGKWF